MSTELAEPIPMFEDTKLPKIKTVEVKKKPAVWVDDAGVLVIGGISYPYSYTTTPEVEPVANLRLLEDSTGLDGSRIRRFRKGKTQTVVRFIQPISGGAYWDIPANYHSPATKAVKP